MLKISTIHLKNLALVFTLIYFSGFNALLAQTPEQSIDAYAKSFSTGVYGNIESFTSALIKPYTTENDKARVIFAWIGTHIRYDFQKSENMVERGMKREIKATSAAEAEKIMKDLQDADAVQCFRAKRGVCQDYSRLFKKMCDVANLESEFIGGVCKDMSRKNDEMSHAWNAVKIDGKWFLLDATWGAGSGNDGSFKAEYSPNMFKVDPKFFILNHLPSDEKWQFLDKPISKEQFSRQAWIHYGQKAATIESVSPLEEALMPKDGQIVIKIKFSQKPQGLFLYAASPSQKQIPTTMSEENGVTVVKIEVKERSYPFIFLNMKKSQNELLTTTIGKFYMAK